MLTFVPKGLCSWDYEAREDTATIASVGFNHFGEQGEIAFAGTTYQVVKHGLMSGRWSLLDGIKTLAEAHKPSALFREFEIRIGPQRLHLKAESALARSYRLQSDTGCSGEIWPAHPFTRRAFMRCSPATPPLTQLFCFWLAALTWRRSAQNSAAHG